MQASISRRVIALVGGLALIAPVMMITAAEAATPRCLGRRATIVGTTGRDRIRGTARADVIVAKGGNDEIQGRGGNDRICAGKGRDEVIGGAGKDRIKGGGGFDLLAGQAGGDRILGQGGSDALFGGGGDDLLIVGPGNFQFIAPGAGNDVVRGNALFDIVSYFDAQAGVNVDLAAGTSTGAGTDTLVNIDGVEGSTFNDTLTGNSASNFLFGLDGNDTLTSGGNAGDLLSPDTVLEFRFDFLSGDAGDDTLTGGMGANVLVHDLAPGAVTVDLQTGVATGDGTDTLADVNVALGTEFADTFRGDNEDNLFEGEGGADDIDGRAGTDTLAIIDAVSGNVDLGAGTATTVYRPFDPITGERGDPITATSTLTALENVWGSEGNDVIRGDGTANRLFGFLGSDQLFGLAGDDHLDGGPDFDPGVTNTLDGGDGTDTCVGGTATNCETASEARAGSRISARRASWFGAAARAIALLSRFR